MLYKISKSFNPNIPNLIRNKKMLYLIIMVLKPSKYVFNIFNIYYKFYFYFG